MWTQNSQPVHALYLQLDSLPVVWSCNENIYNEIMPIIMKSLSVQSLPIQINLSIYEHTLAYLYCYCGWFSHTGLVYYLTNTEDLLARWYIPVLCKNIHNIEGNIVSVFTPCKEIYHPLVSVFSPCKIIYHPLVIMIMIMIIIMIVLIFLSKVGVGYSTWLINANYCWYKV